MVTAGRRGWRPGPGWHGGRSREVWSPASAGCSLGSDGLTAPLPWPPPALLHLLVQSLLQWGVVAVSSPCLSSPEGRSECVRLLLCARRSGWLSRGGLEPAWDLTRQLRGSHWWRGCAPGSPWGRGQHLIWSRQLGTAWPGGGKHE